MMKRYLYCICVITALTIGLQGCELETSDNGDLDGNWQLMEADTINTCGVKNMKELQIFYAIQMRLICIKAINDSNVSGNYYFHFENNGDSLILKTASSEDTVMYSIQQLQPFGLNKEEEKFKVINLNSSNMILKSEMLILKFRKF